MVRKRNYSGITSNEETEREITNRALSRRAAGEGAVLLKNDGILPISTDKPIAIFGNGVANIIKGGTGSGDVNVRRVVSVYEGLTAAGYKIINGAEVGRYMADYDKAENEWGQEVYKRVSECTGSDMNFLTIPESTPRRHVDTPQIVPEEIAYCQAVIYVLSRVAGEGKDREVKAGDYYLTEEEQAQLQEISKSTDRLVIVINTGAQIDIKEWNDRAAAVLYLSQPGMEAGHVLADLLSGAVTPSGKLTTTWSREYSDFPNADTFSHCNGDTNTEKYQEGIYVGYRYFDSFGVEPLYPFGYGLSYTEFEMGDNFIEVDGNYIKMSTKITNKGDKCSGKEIVQYYAACPGQGKEVKRLIGFAKTGLLAPGQSETVGTVSDAKQLASYSYDQAAWVVEAGQYAIFAGPNSSDINLIGVLSVAEDVAIEQVEHIIPLQEELTELAAPAEVIDAFRARWQEQAAGMQAIDYAPQPVEVFRHIQHSYHNKAVEIATQMDDDELIAMLMGEITKGQDNVVDNQLVETGMYVPGAAGETSCRFEEKYGIPAVSMADGPAGLRLLPSYDVDNKTGLIYGVGLISAVCGPRFMKKYNRQDVTTYHMYATAIPIGTMLAQTWNPALVAEVGDMIGGEMKEFGVSWWLAPGMNIHRNPLCGRNFEYYSEDPLVAGRIAAAMTRGVQSHAGVGTTIKHFAANNQEDNRMHSNSVVSERALREIYLRGFEIAVKESQPMCLMTSYNLINGVSSANNKDLLTIVLRGEWDYTGIVMTDWTTTTYGSAESYKCALAGNDLIMPGNRADVENMKEALQDGRLTRKNMETCAIRLIALLLEINEAYGN